MSQFSEVIEQFKITPEALVASSAGLEKFSQKDRDLKDQRETARREKKSYEEQNIAKPSSGRGVTLSLVQRASAGGKTSRLVRGKLLRAVNACLVSQKKEAIDVIALFGSNAKPKDEASEEAAE
jgi:hypothetical protein